MHSKISAIRKFAEKYMRLRLFRLLISATLAAVACVAHAGEFEIGTGIYDITGPVAETGMFGYAAQQETDGLHQRLYARAFIVKDTKVGALSKRIAIVNADLGILPQSIKLEVVRLLQGKYGNLYTHENVLLTATHTHVGSSSISHYPLYQIAAADKSGFGYDRQAYEVTVNGIVNAIVRAHNNLAPGSVGLAQGDLLNATKNRSKTAYSANRDAANHLHDTNKRMVQLKFTKDSGAEVGLLNWFAIHNTSFSLKFTKVSGDNKGYAQWRFEKDKGAKLTDAETFVAAFANSDEGDVVPSDGNAFSAPGYQGSSDEFANAEAAGRKQYDKSVELYRGTQARLSGEVDFRHQWIRMADFSVSPTFSGSGSKVLCNPAIGTSFGAGGENGPSNVPGLYEGMTVKNSDRFSAFTSLGAFGSRAIQLLASVFNFIQNDPCQYPKPVLLATGALDFVPTVLPFQVLVVGKLAVVGLPFEVTTVAGRRIRDRVLAAMAGRVDTVVIAGLANSYAGYLATKEEFDLQHYEGASTQFGPYQLAATEQILYGMSQALLQGAGVRDTGVPVARKHGIPRPGVVFDDKPLFQKFGQVLIDAKPSYRHGEAVTVQFRGAHPKNNLRTQGTFLLVERLGADGNWVRVVDDADWSTIFQWTREGIAWSRNDVIWRIPADTPSGQYRIRHFGDWKSGLNGSVNAYEGVSRTFYVQ